MLLSALLTFIQSTSVVQACSPSFSPSGIASGSWQQCLRSVAEERGEPVPLFGRFASRPDPQLLEEGPTRPQLRALRSCTEAWLRRAPSASGRIELELMIDEEGRARPELVVDTVGDGALALCFVQRAREWRFGPGPGRRVRLPFVFSL